MDPFVLLVPFCLLAETDNDEIRPSCILDSYDYWLAAFGLNSSDAGIYPVPPLVTLAAAIMPTDIPSISKASKCPVYLPCASAATSLLISSLPEIVVRWPPVSRGFQLTFLLLLRLIRPLLPHSGCCQGTKTSGPVLYAGPGHHYGETMLRSFSVPPTAFTTDFIGFYESGDAIHEA